MGTNDSAFLLRKKNRGEGCLCVCVCIIYIVFFLRNFICQTRRKAKQEYLEVVDVDNGTPLQYSCLENPMDGGPWWASVHGVAESDTT